MTRACRTWVLALLAAGCGGGERTAPPSVLGVRDAWARAADSGMVTAVYLALDNGEPAAVTLVGASSADAESVSLHQTHEMDGMVHMMPIDSVAIIAGDSLVLAEGGKHLMVSGLRRTLSAGDSLPLTLQFAGGRSLPVMAAVRSPY